MSWAPFYVGTAAFSRVGRPDLMALCEGNTRSFVRTLRHLWDDLHAEEIAEARAALGEWEFEELAAHGASFPPDEFNLMLLREIESILEGMPEARRAQLVA